MFNTLQLTRLNLKTVLRVQFIAHKIASVTDFPQYHEYRGARWRNWLRHYATSRKVAGSIGIYHFHSSSGRTMTLGSNQPLT
jgi:hypothetical protein